MRALSIRQPWARLILDGRKDVEVRTWDTNFRGEFLIHAGKSVDLEACRIFDVDPRSLATGAIVGKAKLVDVKCYRREEFKGDAHRHLNPPEWYTGSCFGFVLTGAERLDPVPLRGGLGFFGVLPRRLDDFKACGGWDD